MYHCKFCNKSMSRLDSLSRHQRFCRPVTNEMTLRHPFTMIAAGPTSCGKTTWVKKLLESDMIKPRPTRIVYFYKRWQTLYDDMLESIPNIEFVQGIFRDTDFDTSQPTLLIMDDQMREVAISSCSRIQVTSNKSRYWRDRCTQIDHNTLWLNMIGPRVSHTATCLST